MYLHFHANNQPICTFILNLALSKSLEEFCNALSQIGEVTLLLLTLRLWLIMGIKAGHITLK